MCLRARARARVCVCVCVCVCVSVCFSIASKNPPKSSSNPVWVGPWKFRQKQSGLGDMSYSLNSLKGVI